MTDNIKQLIERLRCQTSLSIDSKEAADLLEEMVDAIDDRDELMEINETLTNERDEARREVMMWISERCSRSEVTKEYKKRGWEYLQENNDEDGWDPECEAPDRGL